ncbi:galactokinase [Datura stramonium]|uniref:Galactokinase n=1 Tax=Datura stramonium TaxID=4076 RepID=A0ABS8SL58_DATST|nr:galactokinase [Datura stramonium]
MARHEELGILVLSDLESVYGSGLEGGVRYKNLKAKFIELFGKPLMCMLDPQGEYKGFYAYAKLKGIDVGEPVGLDVIIDGTVPTGSGLSSSAIFVCFSTIAIMASIGLNMSKKEISQLICECERRIGTLSDGMDQAISTMEKSGFAELIDFDPIRATDA